MLGKVKFGLILGFATTLAVGCGSTIDSGGGGAGGSAGSGGASSGGAGGAGGSMPVTVCGGIAGVLCADNEYCDYPEDMCGAFDGQGVCKPRPQACPEIYIPTCGCDGMVHSSDCDAAGAGFDVSNAGCTPPMDTLFACGHQFCDKATQYCKKTLSDVANMPDSFSCTDLPAACGNTPSCMCIGDPCGAPIPADCAATQDGGFLVTCPGG